MSSFTLKRDGWGRLVLRHPDGREVPGVHPVRSFPLSDPNRWVSLIDTKTGQEVVQVSDMAELPEDVRSIVLAELSERQFVPKIQRILNVTGDSPPCEWEVETSRGRTKFTLDSEDHLRKLGDGRLIITDSHGVRYEIVDRKALDAASLKWLRLFL